MSSHVSPADDDLRAAPDWRVDCLPQRRGLDQAIARAQEALLRRQQPDGHWVFPLEADCTIPAEYILMGHYLDEVDAQLQARLAVYLRRRQDAHGGWSLYPGGGFDLSCSVKVYYALRLAGDPAGAPYMIRARQAILAHGGAARCNVFTRITLALFGQIPWRGVPFIPVEIMLLPRWFPFHLSKVSYWSRTVMVPLLILCSLKARARNPQGVQIRELFTTPPAQERNYFPVRSKLNRVFLALDALGRGIEPLLPAALRRRALARAEAWMVERLNGEDGLGGIFPAMVNAVEALDLLGYPPGHPLRRAAGQALRKLLVVDETSAFCQPCLSPVWDTAIACLALQEADNGRTSLAVLRGLDWLRERQLTDEPGDWRQQCPDAPGGGWAFQYANPHYPDVDDTPMVAWALHQSGVERFGDAVRRAAGWLLTMQSKNGGFGAFDVDNTHYYLNHIPFADHGALLDPPTSDVSARCLIFLARLRDPDCQPAIRSCLAFLRREQEADGAWFGRWGTNYIYGTWSVLVALEAAGVSRDDPAVVRAVAWLKGRQRPDGGWGESNDSYHDPALAGSGQDSTAFQTAWAVLGLLAAGEADAPETRRGVEYLLCTQQADGLWRDSAFTAPGFPRVFYLKYHGYDKYFPLWALARYRNLCRRPTGEP
ncbi:MAG: squalene--hopene cyclase [Pseudomonadota bacterium]|nr:squalene--hopene cyclase [Pseudomonadota bacterium]